jgi:hypothetical protein
VNTKDGIEEKQHLHPRFLTLFFNKEFANISTPRSVDLLIDELAATQSPGKPRIQ